MEKIPIKRKLDITQSSQSVWLVKIPKVVYDKWDNCQTGETLGTLNIKGNIINGKTELELTVKLKEDENIQPHEIIIADEYTMDEIKITNQMVPFSYNENEQRYSVKDKISKRYQLIAKQNEKYQQIIRNRTAVAQQVKQAKVIDNAETILSSVEPKQIDFIPPAYVDDRKRNMEENTTTTTKKGRGGNVDIGEVRQNMISAFGLRDYLTFKEIKSRCRSAADSDLRELLRQYTIYHSKGPLKNYYALKPEYRGDGASASSSSIS